MVERVRNCQNCKYGQWDYADSHHVKTMLKCRDCGIYNNWEPIPEVTYSERVKNE